MTHREESPSVNPELSKSLFRLYLPSSRALMQPTTKDGQVADLKVVLGSRIIEHLVFDWSRCLSAFAILRKMGHPTTYPQ